MRQGRGRGGAALIARMPSLGAGHEDVADLRHALGYRPLAGAREDDALVEVFRGLRLRREVADEGRGAGFEQSRDLRIARGDAGGDELFVPLVPKLDDMARVFARWVDVHADLLAAFVIVRHALRDRGGVDEGDERGVADLLDVLRRAFGQGARDDAHIVDVLFPREGAGARGEDGVVCAALEDGEAVRGEGVCGLVELDDVALLHRALEELELLRAGDVLVLRDGDRADGIEVFELNVRGVDAVCADDARRAVPELLDAQDAVLVGVQPRADGKEHMREVVARGGDGEPAVELNAAVDGLDEHGDVAADVRDDLGDGLARVDAAAVRPRDEQPDRAERREAVELRPLARDGLEVVDAAAQTNAEILDLVVFAKAAERARFGHDGEVERVGLERVGAQLLVFAEDARGLREQGVVLGKELALVLYRVYTHHLALMVTRKPRHQCVPLSSSRTDTVSTVGCAAMVFSAPSWGSK